MYSLKGAVENSQSFFDSLDTPLGRHSLYPRQKGGVAPLVQSLKEQRQVRWDVDQSSRRTGRNTFGVV